MLCSCLFDVAVSKDVCECTTWSRNQNICRQSVSGTDGQSDQKQKLG